MNEDENLLLGYLYKVIAPDIEKYPHHVIASYIKIIEDRRIKPAILIESTNPRIVYRNSAGDEVPSRKALEIIEEQAGIVTSRRYL